MSDLLFPLIGTIPKFDRSKETGEFIITFNVTSMHNDETAKDILDKAQNLEQFVLMPISEFNKLVNKAVLPWIPGNRIGIEGVVLESHIDENGIVVIDDMDLRSVSFKRKE